MNIIREHVSIWMSFSHISIIMPPPSGVALTSAAVCLSVCVFHAFRILGLWLLSNNNRKFSGLPAVQYFTGPPVFGVQGPVDSFTYKKLGYRRGTARCVVSIEILPIATQQCRNYLYDKS